MHQGWAMQITNEGQVTNIHVSKLGHHCFWKCLAPSHFQSQCWFIVIWTVGNKFWGNSNKNTTIFIQQNEFENAFCEMAAILFWPEYVNKGWVGITLHSVSLFQEIQYIPWIMHMVLLCFVLFCCSYINYLEDSCKLSTCILSDCFIWLQSYDCPRLQSYDCPSGQSYDCPSASEVTLKDLSKNGLNEITTRHNKAWMMYIIFGMYCTYGFNLIASHFKNSFPLFLFKYADDFFFYHWLQEGIENDPGVGLQSQFPPFHYFFTFFFRIIKLLHIHWIPYSYLTGDTTAELQWHQSDMNLIERIQEVHLLNKKYCQ